MGHPFVEWGGGHTPSTRYPNCSPSWKKIDPSCILSYLLYIRIPGRAGRQTAAAAPVAESSRGMLYTYVYALHYIFMNTHRIAIMRYIMYRRSFKRRYIHNSVYPYV